MKVNLVGIVGFGGVTTLIEGDGLITGITPIITSCKVENMKT